MHVMSRLRIRGFATFAPSLSAISLILLFLVMTCSQRANAFPAFARSTGCAARLVMSRGRC